MNKQTVNERYYEQQKMQGQVDSKVKKKVPKGQEVSLEKTFQQISRGLTQTEQAVRQAGNEQPSVFLSSAETRIDYVIGLVEQIKEELKIGNKMLQGSTKQQIEQLDFYVLQAAQIVQLIQTELQQTKQA